VRQGDNSSSFVRKSSQRKTTPTSGHASLTLCGTKKMLRDSAPVLSEYELPLDTTVTPCADQMRKMVVARVELVSMRKWYGVPIASVIACGVCVCVCERKTERKAQNREDETHRSRLPGAAEEGLACAVGRLPHRNYSRPWKRRSAHWRSNRGTYARKHTHTHTHTHRKKTTRSSCRRNGCAGNHRIGSGTPTTGSGLQ
jgi:hypothetical protein